MQLLGLGNLLVFSLATISLGYFVCIKANKEQGFLKAVGFLLGGLIILVALLFSLVMLRTIINPPVGMMPRPQGMMNTRPMMPQPPAMPRK